MKHFCDWVTSIEEKYIKADENDNYSEFKTLFNDIILFQKALTESKSFADYSKLKYLCDILKEAPKNKSKSGSSKKFSLTMIYEKMQKELTSEMEKQSKAKSGRASDKAKQTTKEYKSQILKRNSKSINKHSVNLNDKCLAINKETKSMYGRNKRTFKSKTSITNDIDMEENMSDSSLQYDKDQILSFQQEIRKKEQSIDDKIFNNIYKKHFGRRVMLQIIV